MSGLPWYLEGITPAEVYTADVPWYTLDFETTNLGKGSPREEGNRVVLTTLRTRLSDGTVSTRTGFGPDLARKLDGLRGVLVAYNAKFELGWLLRLGIDVSQLAVYDPMLAEYVFHGNLRVPLSLDATCKRYGLPGKDPLIDAMMTGGVCPSVMPEHLLIDRNIRDVVSTEALAFQQLPRLEAEGLLPVFFTRCIASPVLAAIEAEGLVLDAEAVETEYQIQLARREEAEQKLALLSNGANLASTVQMAELIYKTLGFAELTNRRGDPIRTATGRPMTDADTLAQLKATTPQQREFLKWRAEWSDANSAITKALAFFRGVCREYDGKFYGVFNQAVTQTHRLSSSGIPLRFSDQTRPKGTQLQNMARAYKRFFRPRDPDYLYVETDGAQLEFRVAGDLSHDPQVLHDVQHDADVHRYTASVLFDKPEDEVTKKERTAAKADTFKPLYGGEYGTKRQMAYYEAFRTKYARIYQTQMGWVHEVLRTGKLRIASGLIFYWPQIKVGKDGSIRDKPNIFNYPVQSFATADIIPISLVYTYWRCRAAGLRARLVNTVHDSAPAEVHKDDLDKYREVVVRCWLDDTYAYLERVYGHRCWIPLAVGFTAGPRWGEGTEEKHSRPPPWADDERAATPTKSGA